MFGAGSFAHTLQRYRTVCRLIACDWRLQGGRIDEESTMMDVGVGELEMRRL